MSYGQQPGGADQPGQQNPAVPPIPQAPGGQPGYGAPSYGGAPAPGYGAPTSPSEQPYGAPGVPSYGGAATPGYGGAPSAPSYGATGYGGGQAPWGGAPVTRPGTVTAGSILAFIGGGFAILIGAILALAGGSGALEGTDIPGMGTGADAGGIFVGLGVVLLLMGALVIFFGLMAFKGKRWAAIALAVLAGLSVLGGISNLTSGDASGLLGTAWSVTGAVLLLVAPSQEYYRSTR